MIDQKIALRCSLKSLGICVFLFGVCFRWLIDGVINSRIIRIGIPFLGLALISGTKVRVERNNIFLLSFFAGILGSLLVNGASSSQLIQALLVFFALLFVIFLRGTLQDLESGVRFLIFVGFFCAGSIFLQFVAKSAFNSVYFSLLSPTAKENAVFYARKGYYFGVNYRPHIAACSLSYSLGAFFFQWFFREKKRKGKMFWLSLLLLLASLMLTQKKGVLIISLLSFIFVILMVYATKRQWIKVMGAVAISGIVIAAGYLYIISHPENVLFYRLSVFLNGLITGNTSDSGRGNLYREAITLFRRNPIFGIGWRRFATLTTSELGYDSSHQVNNDYIQFLCEMGVAGFFLSMIPIMIMLYRTCVVCRKVVQYKLDVQYHWLFFFAAFVQFFTVAYALVEDPFYDIMTFTVYIFSFAIVNFGYRDLTAFRKRESSFWYEQGTETS